MNRTLLSATLIAFLLICLLALLEVSMCQLTKQAQGCEGEPGITVALKYKGIHFTCKLPMDITVEQLNFIITTPSVHTFPLGGRLHLIEYSEIGIYILEEWHSKELTVMPVLIVLNNHFTQEIKFWEIEQCLKCKRLNLKVIDYDRFWQLIGQYQWEGEE